MNPKHNFITRLIGLVVFSFFPYFSSNAQVVEKSQPASTNINQSGFPRILEDLSVAFKIKAPDAKKMQIDLGKLYDMTKD